MMTRAQFQEMKRKHDRDIPFTKEEKKLVLKWKIKQVLTEAGGEMTVGELYKKLGVTLA